MLACGVRALTLLALFAGPRHDARRGPGSPTSRSRGPTSSGRVYRPLSPTPRPESPARALPGAPVKFALPCPSCRARIDDEGGHAPGCARGSRPLVEVDLGLALSLLSGEGSDEHGELGEDRGEGLLDHGILLLRLLRNH